MKHAHYYRDQLLKLIDLIEQLKKAKSLPVNKLRPFDKTTEQKVMEVLSEKAEEYKTAAHQHISDELDEERRREIELGEKVQRLMLEIETEENPILD